MNHGVEVPDRLRREIRLHPLPEAIPAAAAVVRERVLIRKNAQSERYRIEATLRREQIDVDEHNVRHG